MKPRRPLTAKERVWTENLQRIWQIKKKELGINQEDLAGIIGWKSQGSVGQYLTGRIPLNTDAKIRFAKALGVEVSEIDPEWNQPETKPINAKDFMKRNRNDLSKWSEKELNKLTGQIEMLAEERRKIEAAGNNN